MENIFSKLEEYGEKVICYTLNAKGSDKNTSLAITKANELCELDGGRELVRNRNIIPTSFKLHGKKLDFNIIYATPDTKHIAKIIAKKYNADLIMLF